MRFIPLHKIRESAGFSLIELTVVLVIIGISASMAVPSLRSMVDRSRTHGALDRIVGDVAYARVYAIRQGRRTAIQMTSDGTYRIDTMSTGGTWAPIRIVRLRDNFEGVTVTGVTNLEFSSRGLLMNQVSDGYVKVNRAATRDSIFISPAGRVYRAF
jgi:prepilin-type N-terminal cleavage/methylation domain-containing protein